MPFVLALDIGTKRTGVACADSSTGVAVVLPTLLHDAPEELVEAVCRLADERKVQELVVGLPLLPSGERGAQARLVEEVVQALKERGLQVSVLDERFSSPRGPSQDPDAEAACTMLLTYFQRRGS
ncbi:Holliday junction resolvase RuvX [Candidatus Peregrinibacteria bacterium CG10_big_fil_rev_8_21_14_0_10_55_24]|nr:MAG: Holliday junction resolvase RuvX [Candidatus Peregrinibacteria bacterium CG10_big_fil_rev_8_21_14_0_10_55_24]